MTEEWSVAIYAVGAPFASGDEQEEVIEDLLEVLDGGPAITAGSRTFELRFDVWADTALAAAREGAERVNNAFEKLQLDRRIERIEVSSVSALEAKLDEANVPPLLVSPNSPTSLVSVSSGRRILLGVATFRLR